MKQIVVYLLLSLINIPSLIITFTFNILSVYVHVYEIQFNHFSHSIFSCSSIQPHLYYFSPSFFTFSSYSLLILYLCVLRIISTYIIFHTRFNLYLLRSHNHHFSQSIFMCISNKHHNHHFSFSNIKFFHTYFLYLFIHFCY